jgi:flagellar hook assembly protein FlgD
MILSAAIAATLMLGAPLIGFSAHEESKDTIKGTVTDIKTTEVELTVKDEKGKETKVRTKDTSAFKTGDHVVIKDGKVSKQVKPISGGY